jgi:hypothetical protein
VLLFARRNIWPESVLNGSVSEIKHGDRRTHTTSFACIHFMQFKEKVHDDYKKELVVIILFYPI